MYTATNKGFTIITNFGCDQHCPYCISKYHPILQNQQTEVADIDWDHLRDCIRNSSAPTVNLSGGGDPFYKYYKRLDFYKAVYDLVHQFHKELDVHTRILPEEPKLIQLFRKIALSVEYWDKKSLVDLKERYPQIATKTSLRLIQVVDSRITVDQCENYINYLQNIGIKQITFRQMFGNKAAFAHYQWLKEQVPAREGVLFLDDGEYHNYYFTTNNTLYPYFFGYNEKDRRYWQQQYENIEQTCN